MTRASDVLDLVILHWLVILIKMTIEHLTAKQQQIVHLALGCHQALSCPQVVHQVLSCPQRIFVLSIGQQRQH